MAPALEKGRPKGVATSCDFRVDDPLNCYGEGAPIYLQFQALGPGHNWATPN